MKSANWKSRLYNSYVSSGQASRTDNAGVSLSLTALPQITHIVRHHLPTDPDIRIADLGCGHGPLVFTLRQLGYRNVEGVDISPEQVALAQKLGVVGIIQGDLLSFLSGRKASYHVIFLMDVLEHMDKQQVMDLLTLAKDSLLPGGRLIIHVPNAEGIFGMRIRYGDFTHELCFTPQSIRQVLAAAGFNQVTVYEDRPVIHGIISFARNVLWRLLTLRERLLLLAETGGGSHVLSQNMLVVARN